VFDTSGKIDWSLMKNTPFLYSPSTALGLPTAADQLLGDVTYTWQQDCVQLQAMSGADTTNKDEGYLLLNTRGPSDTALQPRMKIDQTITSYCSLLPNANNTLDLGSSTMGFRNAYFTGGVNAATFTGSGANLTALNAANVSTGVLSVVRGGTGVATSTGTGSLVL